MRKTENNYSDKMIEKQIEFKKYSVDLVNSWINNADTKISIAFGIISAIFAGFGAYFSFSLKDYNWEEISFLMIFFLCLGCLGIIAFMCSLFLYGFALFPNFIGKQEDVAKYNLLFYGDISMYKKDELGKFQSDFDNYSSKRFLNDLEKEIFYNSRVCKRKMTLFRGGLIFTGIFTLSYAICFILIMFIK